MIPLSKETKDLIYKTLNTLEKVPKVKDVDIDLKELVKQELCYTKVKTNFKYRTHYNNFHLVNDINITDKLVNSYIGVILKQIRIERIKTAFLAKRISSVKHIDAVMKYYYMSHWETEKCPSSKCTVFGYKLRSNLDRMKMAFTKKVFTFKDITVDEAAELIVKEHTEQLKLEFLKFVSVYFK
jgi:acetolactate synthase small subunit